MSIFKKIGHWFEHLLGLEFDFFKANSKIAVDIVQTIKTIVDSPMTEVAVSFIPGHIAGVILEKVKPIVDKVAEEMAIEYGIIQSATGVSDINGSIIAYLKSLHSGGRTGFWMDLAARLNADLSDGKITIPEAAALGQMVYAEFYHPASGSNPVPEQAPAAVEPPQQSTEGSGTAQISLIGLLGFILAATMSTYWVPIVIIAFAGGIAFMNVNAAWTDDKSRPGKTSKANIFLIVFGIAAIIACAILIYHLVTFNKV